jgi:hypothetical protein
MVIRTNKISGGYGVAACLHVCPQHVRGIDPFAVPGLLFDASISFPEATGNKLIEAFGSGPRAYTTFTKWPSAC